jgi:sugar diacid utilization regulator
MYDLPMPSQLQRLADSLGGRLSRSVAIDDRSLRLLAYNSYAGTVDELRVKSIMRRESPRGLAEYVHKLTSPAEDVPFKVPQRPEFGLTIERIGMPVRHASVLMGFIWLLASDGPLTHDQTDELMRAAERAAHILQRDHLFDELRKDRVREYMRDLLSDDPRRHGEAAEQLIEDEFLVAGPVTALVVAIPHAPDQPLSDKDRLALAIGLDHGCGRTPPQSAVHLERVDHGVVVAVHSAILADREIDDLATALQKCVCRATGYPPEQCYVGIGEHRSRLGQAHGSYNEARRAAEVARATRTLGTIVRYSHLSVYGLLAELPSGRLRQGLHPGLLRLLEHDGDDGALADTLEAFLEFAGDVKRTAERMNLHRASVHYRLHRIEDITHLDLSNGDDRFAMHLGLKVARLVEIR